MATVALHQLQFSDIKALAVTIGPTLLAGALVPTLASAVGAEPAPPWPQWPLTHATLLANFTAVPARVHARMESPWTLVLSALCHADSEHRDRNALALISAGWGPARTLGLDGFFVTFFGGHVAALLNRSGHLLQLRRRLDTLTYNLLPEWAAPQAAKLWEQAVPQRVLGASAGIFALLGADLCVKGEAALRLWRQWQWERERLDAIDGDDELMAMLTSPALGALLALALNVWSVGALVWAEQRSLQSGASVRIGHAAHLTGFAWGAAVYAVRRVLWPRWGAQRRARAGDFGGGRRLGGGGGGGTAASGRRLGGGGGAGGTGGGRGGGAR